MPTLLLFGFRICQLFFQIACQKKHIIINTLTLHFKLLLVRCLCVFFVLKIIVFIISHNHIIHHYLTIGFMFNSYNIKLPDEDFVYNPRAPKKELMN